MHMYVHYVSPTNWLSNKLPKHMFTSVICTILHLLEGELNEAV